MRTTDRAKFIVSDYRITGSLVLMMTVVSVLISAVSTGAQDGDAPVGPDTFEIERLHDGSGSTLLSWNGTTPESPNGERITYFRMPNVNNNEAHTYTGEQWVCDVDLTDHRKVYEMPMHTKGFEHNGGMASWIGNHLIAFRSTARRTEDGQLEPGGTISILNVDTGQVLFEFSAHPGSIAHNPAEGKFPFGVARPENVRANQETYPEIDEAALYVLDLNDDEVSKVISMEKINNFFRANGFGPKPDAHFVHVIPGPNGQRVMTRWVPEGSGRGVLLSCTMEGKDLELFRDRPLHQLWYDTETYIAVDRSGQRTRKNRIVHFQQDGSVIDILAGPGNHIDLSPDRQWLVTDSNYHRSPVEISLYRRGELEPSAVLARHSYGKAIWQKGAHENPVFSRDGQSVYFTHALSNNRVQAVRVDLGAIRK